MPEQSNSKRRVAVHLTVEEAYELAYVAENGVAHAYADHDRVTAVIARIRAMAAPAGDGWEPT